MANRPAPELVLREGDLEVLESWLRATTVPAGLARRARIVLLAAQGMANSRIAQAVGVSVPTVVAWRRRYQAGGVRRLEDALRSGRPGQVPRERVVAATLAPPPKRYGVTHWSSRLLARHLGIGNATVARVWRSLWDPALEVGDLQVLHRPRAGGQGHRRGGPVPGAPGQRRGAVRRREVPDPGPGPHRPDVAHAAGRDRAAHPRPHSAVGMRTPPPPSTKPPGSPTPTTVARNSHNRPPLEPDKPASTKPES